MAGTYPLTSDNQVVEYPFTRRVKIPVNINRFGSFAEQRWVEASLMNSLQFQRTHMKSFDRTTIQTHFNAQQGRYASNWTITVNGITYPHMAFDQDVLEWVEDYDYPTLYTCSLSMTQQPGSPLTAYPAITVSSPPFPLLGTGATAQLPSSQAYQFSTDLASPVSPYGNRAAFFKLATALPSWKLSFPNITDAERVIIENFFIQMRGAWGTFPLVWEGTTYGKCRFDTQELVMEYLSVNQNSIKELPVQMII